MVMSKDEMKKAFSEENAASPEKMGLFSKIINSMFHPGRVFDAVKNDRGIKGAFVYLAVMSLIFSVLSSVALLVTASLFPAPAASGLFGAITYSIIDIIIGIVTVWILYLMLVTFIGTGLTHIGVRLFGGKGGIHNTYKAVAYGSTPTLLLSWIGTLVMGVYISTLLSSLSSGSLTAQELVGALLIAVMIPVVFILLTGIWSIIIEIKGVAVLHNMSTGRAALGCLFLLIIVFVLLFIVAGAGFIFGFTQGLGGAGSAVPLS